MAAVLQPESMHKFNLANCWMLEYGIIKLPRSYRTTSADKCQKSFWNAKIICNSVSNNGGCDMVRSWLPLGAKRAKQTTALALLREHAYGKLAYIIIIKSS